MSKSLTSIFRKPKQETVQEIYSSNMKPMNGFLKVKVSRGVNLAIRDVNTSDPYVVLRHGKNKAKTRVIKNNVNPEWNEDLTLLIEDPTKPIKIEVYDKDTFSRDDPMGDATIDIEPFMEIVAKQFEKIPEGTVVRKMMSGRYNCLAEESTIYWSNGRVHQDVVVRLNNVECGELEMQLQWVNIPRRDSILSHRDGMF